MFVAGAVGLLETALNCSVPLAPNWTVSLGFLLGAGSIHVLSGLADGMSRLECVGTGFLGNLTRTVPMLSGG